MSKTIKCKKSLTGRLWMALCFIALTGCNTSTPEVSRINNGDTPTSSAPNNPTQPQTPTQAVALANRNCILIEDGYGSPGQVAVQAEEVVSGLEIPWGILFISATDMLVTERPGRIRLVQNGQLQSEPVAIVPVTARGEGGLLDIVPHPEFASNRLFYIYYTADRNGSSVNLVERWQLSPDNTSASPDKIIVDNIPVARFHNGGRLRFGPEGMLYIGTGDARNPQSSQEVSSLAGKILRVTPEGEVPEDNPFPGNPAYIIGIRNTQGFDWLDPSTLVITDHGPSGELGRTGHDEVSVASAGANLGWPPIYGCQDREGMIPPSLTWDEAVPPGGAAIYTGDAIPEWRGSLLMGVLGARHLHRVTFEPQSPAQVQSHEVYFQNEFGRLREVIMGPDGELYVTTSNCDGRGNCPPDKDKILRITSGNP
ncbi:PQQ-dependent sugar dehydrogenase [Oscillatoria salina]|uniref:PQQ-dependent sugar dehydrogenase n=1 Tax=Oscillatoria salina TaxID=331517 RepID=UPI001CCB0B15|nr:PQQ-dependent sugar dehydrogenase [Oscillatoria salina]